MTSQLQNKSELMDLTLWGPLWFGPFLPLHPQLCLPPDVYTGIIIHYQFLEETM